MLDKTEHTRTSANGQYKPPRRSATDKERHAIILLLEKHCVGGDDGFARYEDGWSDQRVASEVGCPHASVQKMRKNVKGKLREPTTAKPTGDQSARLDRLEKLVNWLYARMGETARLDL